MKKKIIIISRLKSATSKIVIILGYWHTNGDIPIFFCHNGNTLFFGIFGSFGICGISHFLFATTTILPYFGILGYPNFNSPHLECTWNWDIGGKWDIPKKICHNEKWDMALSGISIPATTPECVKFNHGDHGYRQPQYSIGWSLKLDFSEN